MADFRAVKQVATLPTPLVADTVYMVRAGDGFDLYVTDTTGAIAHRLNADVKADALKAVAVQNKHNKVSINNSALVFDDGDGSASNNDHIWHDDTNNVMHFCSDTALRAVGNSVLSSSATGYSGAVREFRHIAERFDLNNHSRMWRIVTGVKKGDLSMFNVTISGYIYGIAGIVDISVGGYSYLAGSILNAVAVSRGTHHCDYAWLGFDSGEDLNIFVGDGISKFYSGVTLDAKIHHANSSIARSRKEILNPAYWKILDSPTSNPGTATSWSGVTNIIRLAVVHK